MKTATVTVDGVKVVLTHAKASPAKVLRSFINLHALHDGDLQDKRDKAPYN